MAEKPAPFLDYRLAARELILSDAPLREKEGQFIGGMMFRLDPMTPKQAHWLAALLEKHGLPTLAKGGAE